MLPVIHGNDRNEWFIQLTDEIHWNIQDKNTGNPRGRIVMRARTHFEEMGKGDRWICQHIGMSVDELLRLKQITGVAALFANRDFSKSWEAELSDEELEFEDASDMAPMD